MIDEKEYLAKWKEEVKERNIVKRKQIEDEKDFGSWEDGRRKTEK